MEKNELAYDVCGSCYDKLTGSPICGNCFWKSCYASRSEECSCFK